MENVSSALVELLPYVVTAAAVFVAWVVRDVLGKWQASASTPSESGIAWAAVTAVEQMFYDKDGAFKKEEAIDFFLRYFPNMDRAQTEIWVESAVKMMNDTKPR